LINILLIAKEDLMQLNSHIKDIPTHRLLINMKGYKVIKKNFQQPHIFKINYKKRDLSLHKIAIQGRYWQIEYNRIKQNSINESNIIKEYFILKLKKNGGKVLGYNNKKNLIFYQKEKNSRSYGELICGKNNFLIKIIQSNAMDKKDRIINLAGLKNKLDKNCKIVLRSISFEKNRAIMKQSSIPYLKIITEMMKKYPDLILEIQGHTSNVGNDDENMKLSKNRAIVVQQALVNLGINHKRLEAIGFGESSPIPNIKQNLNERIELHKLNDSKKNKNYTIGFLKAIKGFNRIEIYEEKNIKALLQNKTLYGDKIVAKYHLVNKKNSFSSQLVQEKYKVILTNLGAKILGVIKKNLFFNFKGHNKIEVFGVLSIIDNKNYNITLILVD